MENLPGVQMVDGQQELSEEDEDRFFFEQPVKVYRHRWWEGTKGEEVRGEMFGLSSPPAA